MNDSKKPLDISPRSAVGRNLRKLAYYLLELPDDYEHFHMGVFMTNLPSRRNYIPEQFTLRKLHRCGTAACAAGHGPAAGIKPRSKREEQCWSAYTHNRLCLPFAQDPNGYVWKTCFSTQWSAGRYVQLPGQVTIHTAADAGKRILYLLDTGHVYGETYEDMGRLDYQRAADRHFDKHYTITYQND